jgi:phosphohistidine phosphatase
MKYLYVVRHAKSDWSMSGQADFDRGLNGRGKKNAAMMAKIMKEKLGSVDLIVSSPAIRAISTAKYFAKEFSIPIDRILMKQEIYEASCPTLLKIIETLPERAHKVLLFGHNPGFSQLAGYLTGDQVDLPTCAIAGVKFECENWHAVSKSSGTLIYFDYPRRHMTE